MTDSELIEKLADRYSPSQWRLLRVMNLKGGSSQEVTLADLAGHWYFSQPINRRGVTIPPCPELPPQTMELIKALWPHASLEVILQPGVCFPPQPEYDIRNRAGFAVNGLLWETLFPEDFPIRHMHGYLKVEGFSTLSAEAARTWLTEKVPYETTFGPYMHNRFWRFSYLYQEPDCTRIGRELGPDTLKALVAALPRRKRVTSVPAQEADLDAGPGF